MPYNNQECCMMILNRNEYFKRFRTRILETEIALYARVILVSRIRTQLLTHAAQEDVLDARTVKFRHSRERYENND